MKSRSTLLPLLFAICSSLLAISSAYAQSGTWLGNGNAWNVGTAWSGGTIADGVDNTANFTGVNITGAVSMALGANRTIGNITFTDDTTSSHNLTITGNTLTLNVTTGASLIDVTQSDRTLTISSIIAGNDGLTKNGLGVLSLSGANTYTGTTTISGGTLEFSGTGTISTASNINVQSGGTLRFSRNDTWGNHTTGATSAITIDAGGKVESNDKFNALINLTLNGGTLSANNGVNASYPTFGLKGTVTVNATAGGSTISTTGVGDFNTVAIGTGSANGITTFAVANGAAASDLTVSAPLSNLASVASVLTKTGAGTMTLSGTNTYTGATNVNGGTLLVNGSISTSSLTTVASGATLGGTGTVGATVVNGTLAAGNSPGTMNFTSTLTLAGNVLTEIDGNAGAGVTGGHDFVNLTGVGAAGVLTYGGTMTLDIGIVFGAGNYTWNLFDMASETGTFSAITLTDQYTGSLLDANLDGVWDLTSGSNSWQYNESTGVLGLTVIPEPSIVVLGSMGLLMLFRRRR